jgi:hypothetical protein
MGESPKRTSWASATAAHTISASVKRRRREYWYCQRRAVAALTVCAGGTRTGGLPCRLGTFLVSEVVIPT